MDAGEEFGIRFVTGVGYVNRPDLLKRAIASIQPLWLSTIVIDNSPGCDLRSEKAAPMDVTIIEPPIPLSFSQTMNMMHRIGAEQGCDIILFMHNDAEAAPGVPLQLLSMIGSFKKEGRHWGAAFTHYHSFVAFNMQALKEVGPWDTAMPHYYADNDYYRRMRLAGYELLDTHLPVIHHNLGGNTTKSNLERNCINSIISPLSHRYYREKWGGDPDNEQYERPFNSFPINPVENYLNFH